MKPIEDLCFSIYFYKLSLTLTQTFWRLLKWSRVIIHIQFDHGWLCFFKFHLHLVKISSLSYPWTISSLSSICTLFILSLIHVINIISSFTSKITSEYDKLQKACEESKEKFSEMESQDAKCHEDIKLNKAKLKKLEKSLDLELTKV